MKKIIMALVGVALGCVIGSNWAIHSAELYGISTDSYEIKFGNSVHIYDATEKLQKIEMSDKGTLYTFTDGTGYYTEGVN